MINIQLVLVLQACQVGCGKFCFLHPVAVWIVGYSFGLLPAIHTLRYLPVGTLIASVMIGVLWLGKEKPDFKD